MASSLGSLIVQLGADTATLQSDLGRANALFAKNAEEMRRRAEQAGKVMAGMLATTVGAVSAMVKSAANSADELAKMSQKVGVSVESLSALKHQAGLAGVEFSSLQTGMVRFSRVISEASAGGQKQAAVFASMGISLRDMNGQLKPTEQLMREVSDRFAGYRDGATKAALAVELFGRAGADMIPMLNEGAASFDEARREAEAYGIIVDTQAAKASEEFNDNLSRLKTSAQGFGNQLMQQLIPSLASFTGELADGAKQGAAYADIAETVADALLGLVKGALYVRAGVQAMTNAIAANIDILIGFAEIATGVLTNIGHAIAGSTLAMGGHFSMAKDHFDAASNAMAEAWERGSRRVRVALSAAATGVSDAISDANRLADSLKRPEKGMADFSNVVGGVGKKLEQTEAPTIKLGNAAAAKAVKVAKAAKETATWSEELRRAATALTQLQSMADRIGSENIDLAMRLDGATESQIAFNRVLREANAIYEQLLELGPPSADAVEALGRATEEAQRRMDLTDALERQGQALDAYRDQLRRTADMWGDWADAVFDAVTRSGNFLRNLLDNVKQIVTQILREWFRTRVVGSFMGGGMGGLAMGAGMTAMGGGGGAFTDPTMWANAGKSMFAGFDAAAQASGNWFGTYTPDYGTGTFAPSAWGYAAAGAAGVYAGYNRWQNSGRDVGGALGGAAYGVGAYSMAMGAGAAMTGGMAAGLAAIPVVGWIALAAMAVDALSGGKLFGTKGKLHHSNMQLDVGAEGIDLAQSYTLKGQKAFFGGTRWTTKDVTPTDEATAAAAAFYQSLRDQRDAFAKAFGVEAGALVGGSFAAEYDKKGELTKHTSTVLGVAYDEDQEAFARRLGLENMLAVLGQFDDALSDMAASYRPVLDELEAFTNAAALAQTVLMDGVQFLALEADASLTQVLRFAEGVQGLGETLEQTLARLVQAQAAYDEFVRQFAPPTIYVNEFQAAMAGIHDQLVANIAQANALARAAGAEGAAVQDLANIHAFAARQFAAAVAQLRASAQSLAFDAGLSNLGTLDQISAEIARLEGLAGQGAGAIADFGGAMQHAANKANEAIQLLIGDLSPLNDQAKLARALEGLRSGDVTREQVLQIGRRLYASSEQYNELFRTVQAIVPRQREQPQYAGADPQPATHGLSQSDAARLAELYERQAELMAAAELDRARMLAQQIAELSAATGEDFAAIIAGMEIDREAFVAQLGLTSAEDLDAYLARAQAQLDSDDRNTTTIVEALDRILAAIQEQTGQMREGDDEVVGAVREVVGATESVGREIRGGEDHGRLFGRRNEREMVR